MAISNKFAMIILDDNEEVARDHGVKMVENNSKPGMKLRILMCAVLPMKLDRSLAF